MANFLMDDLNPFKDSYNFMDVPDYTHLSVQQMGVSSFKCFKYTFKNRDKLNESSS
jgi:hypothetical protein